MRLDTNYIRFLGFAVAVVFSQGFSEDSSLSQLMTLDGSSPDNLGVFEDLSVAQPDTGDTSLDLDLDHDVGESVFLPQTYALDDCSAFNDQHHLGKRIQARDGPSICSSEPKTSADSGDGEDGYIIKNNDGLRTEPKNSVGLNRYGTNSDGTICPPNTWLLCSSLGEDYFDSICLGCYPCKFSDFAVRAL
jgi:hypothetical protein